MNPTPCPNSHTLTFAPYTQAGNEYMDIGAEMLATRGVTVARCLVATGIQRLKRLTATAPAW